MPSGSCDKVCPLVAVIKSEFVYTLGRVFSPGLLQGYTSEKSVMDDSIRSLEDKKEVLIEELERTRIRLREMEESQQDLHAREEDLERQRGALEQSIGREEQGGSPYIIISRVMDYMKAWSLEAWDIQTSV